MPLPGDAGTGGFAIRPASRASGLPIAPGLAARKHRLLLPWRWDRRRRLSARQSSLAEALGRSGWSWRSHSGWRSSVDAGVEVALSRACTSGSDCSLSAKAQVARVHPRRRRSALQSSIWASRGASTRRVLCVPQHAWRAPRGAREDELPRYGASRSMSHTLGPLALTIVIEAAFPEQVHCPDSGVAGPGEYALPST